MGHRMAMRYTIGTFRTYDRASEVLEDMFANGEICQGERPDIETRSEQYEANGVIGWRYRYAITAQS